MVPLWSDGGPSVRAPETSPYTTAGTYTYTLPADAVSFDFVAVGGGSGSMGTSFGGSPGGMAGAWNAVSYAVGSTQLPSGTTSLTVVVGAGSAGAPINYFTTDPGGVSTVTSGSGTFLTATGGGGGSGGSTSFGNGPGDYTFKGVTYIGGAPSPPNTNGNAPGGGGGPRPDWFAPGWPGAQGAVWIVAYFS